MSGGNTGMLAGSMGSNAIQQVVRSLIIYDIHHSHIVLNMMDIIIEMATQQ